MGKSALIWKWFNDIAPYEMNPLVGRLWWSFYESDASFENFIIRTLAYVSHQPLSTIEQMSSNEREIKLLQILDDEPFLIVLDGLERIMVAYTNPDVVQLTNDDLNKYTSNVVVEALGLPKSAAQSFTGQHRLRKAADPRTDVFLLKLSNVRATRIITFGASSFH